MFTFYSIEVEESEAADLTKPVDYITGQDILNLLKADEQEKEMKEFDIKVGDKFQAEVTDSIDGVGIKFGPFFFPENVIPDFLKHFKKIETTSKEFDLKVGDTVMFNSGKTGKVLEVDTLHTSYPYKITYPDSFSGFYWYHKDGTFHGAPRAYCIKSKLVPHEEAWKENPLAWIVGNYYKNRGGKKVKLIADLRNEDFFEDEVDEYEVLQWVRIGMVTYGTTTTGVYAPTHTDSNDIIDYWEEPKPKLHKKLEKKIRFNDEEPEKSNLLDALTELNTTGRLYNMDYDFESFSVKTPFPRTATIKIEIIED